MAWGLWNRHRDARNPRDPGIKAINMLIAWHIVNKDTADVIVKRILMRRGTLYGLPEAWPGHDVVAGSYDPQEAEDAAALIGEYFLELLFVSLPCIHENPKPIRTIEHRKWCQ